MEVRVFVYKHTVWSKAQLTVNRAEGCFEVAVSDGEATHVLRIVWAEIAGMHRIPVKRRAQVKSQTPNSAHIRSSKSSSPQRDRAVKENHNDANHARNADVNVKPSTHRYNLRSRKRSQPDTHSEKRKRISARVVEAVAVSAQSDGETLREQLILELSRPPYGSAFVGDASLLKHRPYVSGSHYVGLEYDLRHAWDILGCEEGLLQALPEKRALLDHGLPSFVWVPFLTPRARVWTENAILLGNVCLFMWTLYQMTKYTQYFHYMMSLLYPVMRGTLDTLWRLAEPFMEHIYYLTSLVQFPVVATALSSLFQLGYDFWIELAKLPQALWALPLVQRLFETLRVGWKLVGEFSSSLAALLARSLPDLSFFTGLFRAVVVLWEGTLQKLVVLCTPFVALWKLLRDLVVLLAWPLTKLWERCRGSWWVVRKAQEAAPLMGEVVNAYQEATPAQSPGRRLLGLSLDSPHRMVLSMRMAMETGWQSARLLIDAFWLTIGKPIKYTYDIFNYIHGKVGHFFRDWCRKKAPQVKRRLSMSTKAIHRKMERGRRRYFSFGHVDGRGLQDENEENEEKDD